MFNLFGWRGPAPGTGFHPSATSPAPAPPYLCPKCSNPDLIKLADLWRKTPGYDPHPSGNGWACAVCGHMFLITVEGVKERNVKFAGNEGAPVVPPVPGAEGEEPRRRPVNGFDRVMEGLKWRNPKV